MVSKSPIKKYAVAMSIGIIAILIVFHWKIFPSLKSVLVATAPAQAMAVKNKLNYITLGTATILILCNVYIWTVVNKLEKKKRESDANIAMNPQSPTYQQQALEILATTKNFEIMVKAVFTLILGTMVGLIAYTVINPMYSLIDR